jgi:hypothetical protein
LERAWNGIPFIRKSYFEAHTLLQQMERENGICADISIDLRSFAECQTIQVFQSKSLFDAEIGVVAREKCNGLLKRCAVRSWLEITGKHNFVLAWPFIP